MKGFGLSLAFYFFGLGFLWASEADDGLVRMGALVMSAICARYIADVLLERTKRND